MTVSRNFSGIGASPGIGIGRVLLLNREDMPVPKLHLTKPEIRKEIQRYRKAIIRAKEEIEADSKIMIKLLGKGHAHLGEAYALMLEDPIFTADVEKLITKDQVNAEFAITQTVEKLSHIFDSMKEEYFRERKNDIIEVSQKILRELMGKKQKPLTDITEDVIVVAHNLLPSDTAGMNVEHIRGFVVDVGGKTSHTALLAQSLEIPAVVGLRNITSQVESGMKAVVDGTEGLVVVEPEKLALENFRREREIRIKKQRDLDSIRDLPAETLDGKRIELSVNLDSLEEVRAVQTYGAEGVGLFRTEYLYIGQERLPTEEEQFEQYSKIIRQVVPYPTLFRTLDMGGDKLAKFLPEWVNEANPFLGLRAIRFCLKYPSIFKTQLRALLRSSVHGRLRIMFPMVSSIVEFQEGRKILEQVRKELQEQDIPVAEKIELGAMIETPSAALTADLIAEEADFLSIGTNDLIQYTLAVDRINENVATLYDPMHPAILRLIQNVIEAAHTKGKWVGMCGEMASDTKFTRLLLGMGLDEFSVAPSFVPSIKQIIRTTKYAKVKTIAQEVLKAKDCREVHQLLFSPHHREWS